MRRAVLPNYLRVLVDQHGQNAAAEAVRLNGQAQPGDRKGGAALVKLQKEARKDAEEAKLRDISAMDQAQMGALIRENAIVDVPQLVVGGAHKPVMAWPLIQAFHTELLGNPASKHTRGVKAALEVFLEEATDLYKIQCRTCAGYGHTSEYCPTLPRLHAAMGANPTVKCWLGRANKRAYENVRPGVDKAPAMLHLPYTLPKGFKAKVSKLGKRRARD